MRKLVAVLATALLAAGCASHPASEDSALNRIDNIVVIYAENRSFDHLYGLFPGAEGIAQAKFLLAHGNSESGLAERYAGRLHQLRREWAEALPYLLAARPKMRDRKSTRLNSSHSQQSRMPSSA